MTDLDNTQIINDDDSLLQNSSTIDTEASLKIISGAESNTYPIGKETIIGRSNPSDLIISASSLSKQHAKITFNNGQYFITDLGSSNKTFHNKIQLQPHVCYALHDGDEIKLGDILCSFEEHKSNQMAKNTLSEPTYQTYVPAINTLVEEDSPWPVDDDIPLPAVTESNLDVIPSTQTISDSYDDQEPTQPMKIWNGNTNNANRLSRTSMKSSDDITPKENGLTSSFISRPVSSPSNDDDSLVIGGTPQPATIPLVFESTQLNNNDQLEIISSTQTTKTIEDDKNIITIETTTTTTTEIEINDTQTYNLEPVNENTTSNNYIAETQPYELESEQIVTDTVETKSEELHQVLINGDTTVEKITTQTTTTTTTTIVTEDNHPVLQTLAYDLEPSNEEFSTNISNAETENPPPAQTLAYDLQPTNEQIATSSSVENENSPPMDTLAYDLEPPREESSTTTKSTVVEDENPPMQTLAYDLQPTNEPIKIDENAPAICPDTQAYSLDEELEDESPRPASETLEVVPVSQLVEQLEEAEKVVDDSTPKQQVNVIIDPNVAKEAAESEPMHTDQTDIPTDKLNDQQATEILDKEPANTQKTEETMSVEETGKPNIEVQTNSMEQETALDMNKSSTLSLNESVESSVPEEEPNSTLDISENQENEEGGEETEESAPASSRGKRGVPRRAARHARGRRGGAARARVVSTRIYGGRRNAAASAAATNEDNNATLEETVNTETEESPTKSTPSAVERKSSEINPDSSTQAEETSATSQTNSGSNVRVSARIKARVSTGRNRQFPYTDDYVDLDDLEKQSKAANTPPPTTTGRRSTRGGRSSSAPQKRISLRQQPIDATESPEEKTQTPKNNVDVYEQMDTGGENEEPSLSTRSIGRKRKSATPVASTTTKRSRPTTPQTAPVVNTRRKQTSIVEQPAPIETTTPKRGRKSTKSATATAEQASPEPPTTDRPVRIALSSHLNFDQNHMDTLRKLGFEIMDESCHVDALVVDRIRRTKKFFMCLARGAHILSPTWIEAMIKENRYIPYDKYYLEDTNAETRYGFQLRESVRLAKQQPIFENYKIFCTKDTSPPYDDLKDIIEAAGGKFIDKVNMSKPGKDLICIVAQNHKNEYESLYRKSVPIVSEEFALSGISKQKLDFDAFSLFQNAASSSKSTGSSK